MNIAQCPYCGAKCKRQFYSSPSKHSVVCASDECGYESRLEDTQQQAVRNHNAMCKTAEIGKYICELTTRNVISVQHVNRLKFEYLKIVTGGDA